jgi:hypothetical protein
MQVASDDNPAVANLSSGATTVEAAAGTDVAAPPPRASTGIRRDALRAGVLLAVALVVCIVVYLAWTTPGSWFPQASERTWPADKLALVRGTGGPAGGSLVVTAPDASDIALVSVVTDFRSADYPAIAWHVSGLAQDVDVQLLWKTDVEPDKLESVPIRVEGGRAVVTMVAGNPRWIGRVTGLALAIHGALPQPLVVQGVTAKPMGFPGIVRDRLHDWFAYEPWNGASINAIAGGEDYQPFPLPVLLALAVGLAGVAVAALARFRPSAFRVAVPAILASFFLCAWALLDARWTFNLFRQDRDTAARFGGKDAREKHLANEDADLYAFVQRALKLLPSSPTRIFIASDLDYFRGRAAYHLYPHRVYFDPRSNQLPAAQRLHRGDWLLVYRQRGIQFDRALGKLRWDGGRQIVDAQLKLVEPGAALFLVQ